jgi:hypothetical protein
MRKIAIFLLIGAGMACNNTPGASDNGHDSIVNNTETVSETRAIVKTSPIANYHEKVGNALNDWGFDIKVYETNKTFYYLMKIKYEETEVSDTLKIPNVGIKPVIELHQGKGKYACIVGFLDKEHKFRDYKLVSVQNDQLKIKVLNHYGVYSVVKETK